MRYAKDNFAEVAENCLVEETKSRPEQSTLGKHSKKIRDYLGIFPNIGGGLPNSQNFCYLTIALKKTLKTP